MTEMISSSIREVAIPLKGAAAAKDALIDAMRGARIVLIGEASHGTREFYRERAEITKRLIRDLGFNFVAVEADWPDAFRINRFVKNQSDDRDAEEALSDFRRFPAWMWRNREVAAFIGWLHDFNQRRPEPAAGFYGLDLYSLYASIEAVIDYLEGTDPALAQAARMRYGCFDQFEREPQAYGLSVEYAGLDSCEEDAVRQLIEMQRLSASQASREGPRMDEEAFFAEQNARLVKNAERYYRAMYRSDALSWNVRDEHMAETLDALILFHERYSRNPKAVIWAHNSHVGDARATQMSRRGELNIGQLMKQRYGAAAFAIGFTTHAGTVTAARNWGDPGEQRQVRPALRGSFEESFNKTGIERFLLLKQDIPPVERLERAIGVIYRPEYERQSHYFDAVIADQFDAVIHIDRTHALEPLEVSDLWRAAEPPEPPVVHEEAVRA